MHLYAALLQIPGIDAPALTWQEQISTNWENTGFMRWPLALCLVLGIIVIAGQVHRPDREGRQHPS